jgi:hypothetical protein
MKIVGAFILCGLQPVGIIDMGCKGLKHAKKIIPVLSPMPTHWSMTGIVDDELRTVYEEKDGLVLVNLFEGVL